MGDGGLADLGRVTENILVLCVEEHGLFNERDGHVLTVHVAAAVDSVAADEGIVDLRELLEVGRGLIADYRAGMAADDAAAYMNLEPRTAREIVRRLHGVGVYDAVRDIGKKIAQRIILELKDKLAKEQSSFTVPSGGGSAPMPLGGSKSGEAAAALAVLGYGSQEISTALKGIDMDALPLEEIIRQALKKMVK